MADLSEQFATDDAEAESGRWFNIPGPLKEGQRPMRVRLRSVHSRKYRMELAKLARKFRTQFLAGDGVLDADSQDDHDVMLGSRALIVEWEGVYDEGKEVPSSAQPIQDTLRKFPAFRRMLLLMAKLDENFRPIDQAVAELEAMAGNSSRPSGTINA